MDLRDLDTDVETVSMTENDAHRISNPHPPYRCSSSLSDYHRVREHVHLNEQTTAEFANRGSEETIVGGHFHGHPTACTALLDPVADVRIMDAKFKVRWCSFTFVSQPLILNNAELLVENRRPGTKDVLQPTAQRPTPPGAVHGLFPRRKRPRSMSAA